MRIMKDRLVFETRYVRYAICRRGWNQSLLDLATGTEYCRLPGRYPFVSFGNAPAGAPRRVTAAGNRLRVDFVQAGAYAVLQVTERPHYVVFEIKELRGCSEPVFNLATLGIVPVGNVGKILNIAWSRAFGVGLLALNLQTESFADTIHEPAVTRPVLTTRTHAGLGHVGGKYALVAGPRQELERLIMEAARDHGLPCPHDEHGVPMKHSYRAQRSYLFLMHMGTPHADFALDVARRGGFGLIMNDYYWTYQSYGSYRFRSDQWPGGLNDLVAWARRCHKTGLGMGLHCMSSCVAENDPLVPDGTRHGFVSDGGNVLAEDITARATTLPVMLPPHGRLAGGVFRLEDEFIRLGDMHTLSQLVAVPPPPAPTVRGRTGCYNLRPVVRGVSGTRPAPHRKGTPLIHFRTVYGFCPDLNGPIADRVAARLAEIMNRCGTDMVYFDGLEGVHDLHWHNVPHFAFNVLRRLDRENIVVQASTQEHLLWHVLTRANSGDTAVVFDETPAEHVRAKEVCWMRASAANLLRPVFDWHGWNFYNSDTPMGVLLKPTPATTLRDWAVYLEAARRLDVPLGVLTGIPDLRRNPDTARMLEMTREYEQERIRRLYGEKI